MTSTPEPGGEAHAPDGDRATLEESSGAAPLGTFASFRNPQFAWLFVSNTTFFLAMGAQQVLRAWLVFDLTGSEFSLGLITGAVGLPMLLIGPLGGAYSDRYDRRKLVAAGQAVVLVSELLILTLLLSGRLEFWHLLCLGVIMGSVFPFIMPARNAIVANVVGRDRLTNAMALNMAAVNTTRVLGPAAAGLLIGTVGLEIGYTVSVVLYSLALFCMSAVSPAPPPEEGRSTPVLQSVLDGFRYAWDDRLVLVLLFFGLVPMFLAMPFQNLLVVFARDIWEVGPQGLGSLSATAGLGGMCGAMLVAWRSSSPNRLRWMVGALVGFGFFLFVFSLSPWFLLALPLVFVANVCLSLYGALNNTAIQVIIPDKVRGRISSFLLMSFSLPLLGTVPVAAFAEAYGAPFAVAGASVLAVLVGLAFLAGSSSLRKMDERIRKSLAGPDF